MKWLEKELVIGTQPPIRIGKRVFKSTDGSEKTTETFWATFSANGKQRFVSLEVFKRDDAIREAHRLAHRLETQTQPLAERKGIKLGEIVDAYLGLLKGRGRAFKTMEKYTYVLKKLQTWWEKRGNKAASRFTVTDFYGFKEQLERDGMSQKTIADRLMIVRQLLKWASSKAKPRLLPTNPIADEPLMQANSPQQPCFSPEQVNVLLDSADPILRPIFATMAYTGMRFGEVRDLMWNHVQLREKGGAIRVYGGGSGRDGGPKDHEHRTVPVNAELARILSAMPREQARVFSQPGTKKWPYGSRPLDQTQLLKALKRLCKQVGFPDSQRYKLHSFRHGFASMCARKNLPQKYILDWMGHSKSDILDMYITLHDETAQRAINQISFSGNDDPQQDVPDVGAA